MVYCPINYLMFIISGVQQALPVIKMDDQNSRDHAKYIQILRQMTPEQRLLKAFDLSEFTKQLFIHGLRKRFPDLPEDEFRKILMERLDKCHNRNY